MEEKLIKLKLITPMNQSAELECDCVRMIAKDNSKNRGGGDFGVRYGHIDTIAALEKGHVLAISDGEIIKKFAVSGGFAKINRTSVTVLTEKFEAE